MGPDKKKNKQNLSGKTLVLIGGGFVLLFLGYIFYRTYQSERSLLSFMMLPLILGIVFENRRLSSGWKTIALKILGSLLLSYIAFIQWGEKNYSFEDQIEAWPYFFLFFFVLASVVYHGKSVVPKLTEGITLLQSISIVYWIIDMDIFDFKSIFAYIILVIGLAFCVFSFIHAFFKLKLTRRSRLFLSIWSSIIMLIFAVDYIYRVFNFNDYLEYRLLNGVLNIIQYFLLGVSLIYIFQNIRMLMKYLPSRSNLYNKQHMKEIYEMNKTHIGRYSEKQINRTNALFALIVVSGIYFLNYIYQIIPRHTMIWLVFWLFPIVVWLKENINKKKTIVVKNT